LLFFAKSRIMLSLRSLWRSVMLGRLGLVATLVFTIAAPAAFACNDPSLGVVTQSARAGDSVSFSAVHLDPGARYSVLIAGRGVVDGIAGDRGTISGSFTMPDLGRAGTYSVELHVAHDDGTWISSRPVTFVVPKSAVVSTPAPAPRPATVAAPTRAKPTPKATAAATSKQGSERSTRVQPKATPAATAAPTASNTAMRSRASSLSGTRAASIHHAARRTVVPPHKSAAEVVRPRASVSTWAAPATEDLGAPVLAVLAPRQQPVSAAPAGRRGGRDLLLVPVGILGIALSLGVGSAAMLVRIRRLRRNASLAVEAELQEIIAEAHAARSADLREKERV
jgi:hypothetical protein